MTQTDQPVEPERYDPDSPLAAVRAAQLAQREHHEAQPSEPEE